MWRPLLYVVVSPVEVATVVFVAVEEYIVPVVAAPVVAVLVVAVPVVAVPVVAVLVAAVAAKSCGDDREDTADDELKMMMMIMMMMMVMMMMLSKISAPCLDLLRQAPFSVVVEKLMGVMMTTLRWMSS